MPTLPPGPNQSLPCPNAPSAPFYVLPFDKRGICEAPATRSRLLEDAATGRYTDIFVFSHGWNNDWPGAVKSYRHFIDGFMAMVQERELALPARFRPLYWSASTGRAPRSPLATKTRPAWRRRRARRSTWPSPRKPTVVRDLAEALPAADAARFYALLQQPRLNAAEVQELAQLAAPLYAADRRRAGRRCGAYL
jgi:hypothetical protein